MRLPIIRGVIDRRILANFRIAPEVLAKVLPPPFRPQVVHGYGVAGICLIRLKHVRPAKFPAWMGISSENAAHRIAVEWNVEGEIQTGVYIPRRDTSSMLNVLAGGRIFPGVHNRARFEVNETKSHFSVGMKSIDGKAHLAVEGDIAECLPDDSIFSDVTAVSDFFESGSLGYSPATKNGTYDGLELRSFNWQVEPLVTTRIESSFFDDRSTFPAGSVTFDNALLMRDIDHQWHGHPMLCCSGEIHD